MKQTAPRYIHIAKWACVACSLVVGVAWSVSNFRSVVFQAPYVLTILSRGRISVGTSRLDGVPVRNSVYFISKPIEAVGPFFPGFDSWVTLGGWNMLAIPLWLPFGLAFVPATILVIRYRRRTVEGHCQKCDYDLTGNESGRCPECGTKIESP